MATIQDLIKQKVIRRVQRSDKGKAHAKRGYKIDTQETEYAGPYVQTKSLTQLRKMKNGK